jgi:hypothetical protein
LFHVKYPSDCVESTELDFGEMGAWMTMLGMRSVGGVSGGDGRELLSLSVVKLENLRNEHSSDQIYLVVWYLVPEALDQ